MAYHRQMAFRRALVTVSVVVLTACAGSDDDADTTPAEPTTTTTVAPTTTTTTVAPQTTVAPTTTVNEAALIAEIEQAYLDAFWVATQALRNPDDPDNEARVRNHFTGPNLDAALEDLRRMIDGGLVARENPENPSLAVVIEPPEFVDESPTHARMTVCEFDSDRIYEVGTAPDGGDTLRRDDPISLLIVVDMERTDGEWKAASGGRAEQVRREEEQCSNVR